MTADELTEREIKRLSRGDCVTVEEKKLFLYLEARGLVNSESLTLDGKNVEKIVAKIVTAHGKIVKVR